MLIGGWKITELDDHDYVALVLLCDLLQWLHYGSNAANVRQRSRRLRAFSIDHPQ